MRTAVVTTTPQPWAFGLSQFVCGHHHWRAIGDEEFVVEAALRHLETAHAS